MKVPTYTFYLDTRHKLKDGHFPYKLTVYFMGSKKRYATGFSASKDDHLKLESGLLKDNRLKKLKTTMYAWLDEQSKIGEKIVPFNFTDFEEQFLKKDKDAQDKALSPSVEKLFDEYIAKLVALNRVSTAETYTTAKRSFQKFRPHLRIDQVTTEFLNLYESWMLENNKSLTTVGFYNRALRTIYNLAIEKKVVDQEKYPFKKYTIPSPKKSKKALKKEDIKKILNYSSENPVHQKAIDFWVLSYLCNGMNFKDIALLKNEFLDGDYIQYNREKIKHNRRTNVMPIRVPLNDRILEIISRYRRSSKNPKDYIFPILENWMNQQEIEAAVYQFIDRTNTILVKIGESLELSLRLTTSTARHSFATRLKNTATPLLYISEAMGHSDPKTTINYLGSFEDDDIKQTHKRLLEGMMD